MTLESENQYKLLISIKRMAELLTLSKQHQWAATLTSPLTDPEIKPNLERFILSLYGGMGSLNDIVLYINGEANSEINDEFDDLRTSVFELCCKAL